MDDDEGTDKWKKCIRDGDIAGLRVIVSQPGFDFQETATFNFWNTNHVITATRAMTPLGYVFEQRNIGAFHTLLYLGADPNATHLFYDDDLMYGTRTFRLVEKCLSDAMPIEFLHMLFDYGATVSFARSLDDWPFIECIKMGYDPKHERSSIILAAHDRELRAYTVVWCALNAGGCWPDMAMLLQAMVMRDDLSCETSSSPSSKRQRK